MANGKELALKPAERLNYGRLRPGAIQLTATPKVTAKDLHESLDRILNLHGCPNCGMNGLDIIFRYPDPIVNNFNDLQGIGSVFQG